MNILNLENVIESCHKEYERYNEHEQTESNSNMCELLKKNMKKYQLDLKYYCDKKNPLYVQKLNEMWKEKWSSSGGWPSLKNEWH